MAPTTRNSRSIQQLVSNVTRDISHTNNNYQETTPGLSQDNSETPQDQSQTRRPSSKPPNQLQNPLRPKHLTTENAQGTRIRPTGHQTPNHRLLPRLQRKDPHNTRSQRARPQPTRITTHVFDPASWRPSGKHRIRVRERQTTVLFNLSLQYYHICSMITPILEWVSID
jgi:hypothetical protein